MKQISEGTVLLAGGIIVHRVNIIGTNQWTYSAWKPVQTIIGSDDSSCSNITTGLGWTFHQENDSVQWYGRLGTEGLPADMNALKGDRRWSAVEQYQEAKFNNAYAIIESVFPEAATGRKSMGDISLTR